tara:strand:+ start:129 stop:1169 length:1041 start_codon:yes stop_codon:yes gene_type:complete
MKKINILVTGAGSGVGQSIIKSLKISKINCNIISADISEYNAGLYRTKKSILVPKVEKKGTLRWYIKNLKKLKINVLMIGSEFDINFFSKNKYIIKKKTNCEVCVADQEVIKMANDKYLTQIFLKDNNLPFLRTYAPKNLKEAINFSKKLNLPFVLKSRIGTSSRNVYVIKNLKDLVSLFHFVKKPILQEHIGSLKNDFKTEYTCSFFTTKNKEIMGPFIAKRKILNGTSWITEVTKDKKISDLVIRIAKSIDNKGSFNIQLRKSNRGPIPFEFNPRFSGTTSIRSNFGFNEPEMFVKNFFQNKALKNPKIKTGICLRYIEEIFLEGINRSKMSKSFGKGQTRNWF